MVRAGVEAFAIGRSMPSSEAPSAAEARPEIINRNVTIRDCTFSDGHGAAIRANRTELNLDGATFKNVRQSVVAKDSIVRMRNSKSE